MITAQNGGTQGSPLPLIGNPVVGGDIVFPRFNIRNLFCILGQPGKT